MKVDANQLEIQTIQKVSFFKKNKLILIACIILLLVVGAYYFLNHFLIPPTSSDSLIYNTRSVKGVSENQDELFELIGFHNKHISAGMTNGVMDNGIIKSKDDKYLFFSADRNNCTMSCTAHGYMVNVDKKTISDFKISSVLFNVTPVFGSLVLVRPSSEKIVIYDPSKDKIIDEMLYPVGETRFPNLLFSSDRYFTYTYKNILYSRDIAKHLSTPIENSGEPKTLE